MSKNIFIFLLLNFFAAENLFAQGEANIWYFGENAGMDFNNGNPVAISGPTYTLEGTASISDSLGNILFSTDGVTVYNAVGDTLATGLFGNHSTTQSSLILKMPNSTGKYYIFTADAEAWSHGICYSIVDMTLNSGLGGLISTNVQLITPACEKLTAIRNSNGTDYWIIVHAFSSNEFYAYPFDSMGVGAPAITSIGLSINYPHGYLKASPNGQKIAMAASVVSYTNIEMFDFNATTGILSNYISFPDSGEAYGISFSPNNTKLYVSYWGGFSGGIKQYDLTIPNFQNSPYTLIQGGGDFGAIQLAPNGKIYCAKVWVNSIGVINNPNLTGASCNYVDNGFNLLTGTLSALGLPNFIDSYFEETCSLSVTLLLSFNDDTIFTNVTGGIPPYNYEWSTGATSENLIVANEGGYSVTVTDASGCVQTNNISIVGIENISSENNLNLYPNPSSNTINISSSTLSGKYSLKIYNLLGQQVKQQEVDFSFEGRRNVNIESLASGYYQLMLVNGSNVVSKRFVKE